MENKEKERAVPYGYTFDENNKIIIDDKEAQNIRNIISKFIEYTENPPKYLVQEVLDMRAEEHLTYEEAAKLVNLEAIEKYIATELNQTNMSKRNLDVDVVEQVRVVLGSQKYTGLFSEVKHSGEFSECEPIISKEQFEKVRSVMNNVK
ncbi:MAG: hypothetical protein ACLUFH_00305 [Monoglobales bacterium]